MADNSRRLAPRELEELVRAYTLRTAGVAVPTAAASAWRRALADEPERQIAVQSQTAGSRARGPSLGMSARPALRRALILAVGGLAATIVLVLALSALFPGVALWAGSLPGVGTAFRFIGFEQSLSMSYPAGLVVPVDREATSGGITLRVFEMTADNQRTIITAEAIVPERFYQVTQHPDGGESRLRRYKLQLEDQWGHLLHGWDHPREVEHAGPGLLRLELALEFPPVPFRTRHLTLWFSEIHGTSFEDMTITRVMGVRFPVNLSAAASRSQTIRPGTSATVDGATVTLEEIRIGHTGTQATLRHEGLVAYGNLMPMIGYCELSRSSWGTVTGRHNTVTFNELPLSWVVGEHGLIVRLGPVLPVDLDFTLPLDGGPSSESFSGPEGLVVTIESWSFSDGTLEAELAATAYGSASLNTALEFAVQDYYIQVGCEKRNLETAPHLAVTAYGRDLDTGESDRRTADEWIQGRGRLTLRFPGLTEPPQTLRLVAVRNEVEVRLTYTVSP